MLVKLIITGLATIILLFLGRLVLRSRARTKKRNNPDRVVQAPLAPVSIADFSGDNLCDTQLDLAKAYIELHQYEKAKPLLKLVTTHGTAEQILEARKMFAVTLRQERLS